jgi:hypothetical protein
MNSGEIVRVVLEVRVGKDGHEHVHVLGAFRRRCAVASAEWRPKCRLRVREPRDERCCVRSRAAGISRAGMTTAVLPGLERGSAVFSPCGRYRYELHRAPWGPGPHLLILGANPSYATAEDDDHTIRKDIGFARRWGFGSLSKGNVFAFISTDPAGMYAAEDPVGPDNDRHIVEMALNADAIWCAWGDIGLYRDRDVQVFKLLAGGPVPFFCIGTTKRGSPLHPSRPGYATPRMEYRGRPA